MKYIGYISATIIFWVYSSVLNGWALTKLWAWFIVPTFGLEQLTIVAAIGLSLVVKYLTMQIKINDKEKPYSETLMNSVIISTVKPLMALLIGSIVKMWM